MYRRIVKTTGGMCAVVLYIQNNTIDVWREYGYVFTKNTQVEIVKMKLSWMRIVKSTGGMCAMVLYIQNNTMTVCREYGFVITKNTKVEIVNCQNNRRHVVR